jgi:hypothetical protein
VAFAVGIAFDIALTRRRWRDAWIVAVPLLLYLAWTLYYHPSPIQLSSVTAVPLNVVQTTAAALAGLLGLSGVTPLDPTGDALVFGIPLLVLAVAALLMRAGTGWDWTRFVSLAATLATFSVMTTLVRTFQSPFESRYLYVTCVLAALMVAELARGLVIPPRSQLALAALTVIAVVSGVSVLRSGGGYFRELGTRADATFAAVDLDAGMVAPHTQISLYPLGSLSAGRYFAARRAVGTPAFTVAELERTTPAAQSAADAQSVADRAAVLSAVASPSPPRGTAVPTEAAAGGGLTRAGACVTFTPATLAPGGAGTLVLRLDPARVSVSAGPAPAMVAVRRFAPTFTPLGSVQPRGSAIVSASHDRALRAWHLRVQSVAPVHVCTLPVT